MTEFLSPTLSEWDFAERERQLRDTAASSLPTLRMADVGRRLLAGTASELNQRIPKGVHPREGMQADLARQLAAIGLAFNGVRATTSAVTLIESGYEREAFMPIRSLVESLVRSQQLAADSSGEVARLLLQGRPPRGLKQAAQQFGMKQEIEFLDRFAHSDLLSVEALVVNGVPGVADDGYIELKPVRGVLRPASQLRMLADNATRLAVLTCEVFEVGLRIPPFLSGQLKHYRANPLPAVL